MTLARAPACAADPRVTRVGMLLLVITGAADSDILLTLPARLVVLSSTAGRGPGETYTDMLGCSMRRSSMGLASAEAPSAVKQGGGVTNQLSSMLQEHDPHSLNNTFTSTDSR